MKSDHAERKRFALRRSDRIVLGIVAALAVAVVVLNILQRAGLSLINGALMLQLPFLALFVLVGWGGYVLFRRLRNRTVRIIVGGVLAVVLFLALMLVFTYISFIATITVPQRYTTVASPSGAHRLVVMRGLDPDEDRIEARKAARLSDDPEADPEVTVSDWGYVYRAYPQVLGLFYRSNADVEGEVHLAYTDGAALRAEQDGEDASDNVAVEVPHGTLMLEWLDDESTAHFFVEDPGIAEGGDCYVRF